MSDVIFTYSLESLTTNYSFFPLSLFLSDDDDDIQGISGGLHLEFAGLAGFKTQFIMTKL